MVCLATGDIRRIVVVRDGLRVRVEVHDDETRAVPLVTAILTEQERQALACTLAD